MSYLDRIDATVASKHPSRRRAGKVFTREWTELEKLPKEVKEDPHLEVRQKKAPAKKASTKKPAPKKQEPEKPPSQEPPKT